MYGPLLKSLLTVNWSWWNYTKLHLHDHNILHYSWYPSPLSLSTIIDQVAKQVTGNNVHIEFYEPYYDVAGDQYIYTQIWVPGTVVDGSVGKGGCSSWG